MKCPTCASEGRKHGKDKSGQQRYRCGQCRKTYLAPKPMAGSRTPLKQVAFTLNLLLEGMSARSVERLTGMNYETAISLMVQAGEQCRDFLSFAVYQVPVNDVEVDEVWGFVHCKQKAAWLKNYGPECGDAYCFVALERTTKLVLAYHVGKRDPENTEYFASKLNMATSGRFQLSTDGFGPYRTSIPHVFHQGVDFGQLVKDYASPDESERRRYSPPKIVRIEKLPNCGNPDQSRICTSHIERHNLSTRMHVRRMTRLTNAHSKKWENHEAALALYFCWYNWCRTHSTLKSTPAVAAGLATETWTLEKLLTETAKVERKFATLS